MALTDENRSTGAKLQAIQDSESTKEPQVSSSYHKQEVQVHEKKIKELE